MSDPTRPLPNIQSLLARLRGPDGCPWDQEQKIEDIRGYLLEEAHEVASAIDKRDWDELCSELGDLLFEIVFVAQIAQEKSKFDISQVVDRIEAKMIERHPHVFADERLADSTAVRKAWERRKQEKRGADESALGGVPASLPALLAAYRMSQKAAALGFDWSEPDEVLEKISEEIAELRQALQTPDREDRRQAVREEMGDLILAVAKLSRKLELDPEAALARSNEKFRLRFQWIEKELAKAERSVPDATMDELEQLWQEAKRVESD